MNVVAGAAVVEVCPADLVRVVVDACVKHTVQNTGSSGQSVTCCAW